MLARPLDAFAYALLVLAPVAFVLLGRRVVLVCAIAVAATATYLGLGYPTGPIVLGAALALLRSVITGRRLEAWACALGGYVLLLGLGELSGHPLGLTRALAYAAWLVVVLLVGEGPRYRAAQFAEARRARAAETEVAAGEERLAIARDLHDTIGHSLSMITVQAGVALHLLDEHPEQARPALTAIRAASKDALEEVRLVLAVLRAEGDLPRGPGPGVARIPELADAARSGGLAVALDLQPPDLLSQPWPGAVGAAAYRVVQESLTNVSRHAQGRHVTIALRRGAGRVLVEVVDDGVGARPAGQAGVVEGGGLRGMRERARALGGSVEAGPVAGGGWRVAVQFPLDNEDSQESPGSESR
jgi:signal transduction histidine kinase